MPEGPDVEIFVEYFNANALDQKIESIEVKTTKVLDKISAATLKKWLTGKKFISAKRYGKYLLVKTNDEKYLVMHFGMSGELYYYEDSKGETEHARVLFNFENGCHLAYISQRMLGKISRVNTLKELKKEKRLGADVNEIEFEDFKEIISTNRGSVKSFLMNQKYIAGIGNIYSDEILFQAKIHPKKPCIKLTDEQIKLLYEKMLEVINIAIDKEAKTEKLPDNYILPHKDTDMKCPDGDEKMKITKVSGRTAYFCSKSQK